MGSSPQSDPAEGMMGYIEKDVYQAKQVSNEQRYPASSRRNQGSIGGKIFNQRPEEIVIEPSEQSM